MQAPCRANGWQSWKYLSAHLLEGGAGSELNHQLAFAVPPAKARDVGVVPVQAPGLHEGRGRREPTSISMDLVALAIDQVLGERHQAGSQCLLERVGTESVNVQHNESSSHLPLYIGNAGRALSALRGAYAGSVERDLDERAVAHHRFDVVAPPVARNVRENGSPLGFIGDDPSRPGKVGAHPALQVEREVWIGFQVGQPAPLAGRR